MLELEDKWTWDFWFARRGDEHHMFYLQAPRSLGDEKLRHRKATIGHAVSADLREWSILPDALHPGPAGSWDDMATWTGCVIEKEERWYMFYTGISSVENGLVQRIGVAWSDDLTVWHKHRNNPVMEADPRWYELLGEAEWHNQAWRDPWVYLDEEANVYRALITARSRTGETSTRGVIAHGTSTDLIHWEIGPPVAEPRVSGDLEVPQILTIGARSYVMFCCYRWDDRESGGLTGPTIAYLVGDNPAGPFRWEPENGVLVEGKEGWYSARAVEDTQGELQMLAWRRFDESGEFVGNISDPVPLHIEPSGLKLNGSFSPLIETR